VGVANAGLRSKLRNVVPTNDIMAYDADPPNRNKCVSTLDVEGVAIRMSNYLDVNADGRVDGADQLFANDQIGEGGNPRAHHGELDCPRVELAVCLAVGEGACQAPRVGV
jgi:hypothetical protein